MKLTERDKTILLLLPGVAIFAAYGWFFYPSKHTALVKAEEAVAKAREEAPALQNKVQFAQAKVVQAKQKLTKLAADRQTAQKAWDQASANCTDSRLRNERIARLNDLLGHHKLRVIEDAESDASGKDGKVATSVENLCTELAGMSAQLKPQLRKVRLIGRYLDVVAALDELAHREVVAIPVGLMMKEAPPHDNKREWVLLVWI
jgi:hypothetical protein